MDERDLREQVDRAREGSRQALERLVDHVRHDVYGLAMRMLGEPADAEDAAQEILIKVVTKLDTFRGESKFTTWVYRIACNHLLNRRRQRRPELSFDEMSHGLELALGAPARHHEARDAALVEELRLFCTHGMLLCLDREHRLAYVLGEILELPGSEAAAVLDISPAAFRKRLQRARADMEAFLRPRCGLVEPANQCRCRTVAPVAVAQGMIDPDRLRLATHPTCRAEAMKAEVVRLHGAAEVFRSHPRYAAPDALVTNLQAMLRQTTSLDH